MKGGEVVEIKRYKGLHTCVNPLTKREHQQLDVVYKSALIRLFNKS